MTITHTLFDIILYHPIRFLLYSPERILFEDLPIKERRWLTASGKYRDNRKEKDFIKRFEEFSENGDLMGYVDLMRRDGYNNSLYVILVVSKYHRRKGVASKLMKKCVKYCKENSFELQYCADVRNKPSNALARYFKWKLICNNEGGKNCYSLH